MKPILRTSLNIATWLFAIWYAVGLVLLTTSWIPHDLAEKSRVWGDVVFLLLAATVTFLYSAKICGGRMALLISAIVLAVSAGAELFGAKTGYPFGHYEYTENLGPKLLGLMPMIIPFCWLTIVLNAFWIVSFLFQRYLADPSAKLLMFISGAMLAVLTDFNLEPVASLVKLYWIWYDAGSGYLGIPGLNFFGWWMVSFVILNMIYGQLPEKLEVTEVPWTSYCVLAAINLLFGLINYHAGFLLPVFVALNTFGILGILLAIQDKRFGSRKSESIEVGDGGLILIEDAKEKFRFDWKQVVKIEAYKVDQFTVDAICLRFHLEDQNTPYVIHDEIKGHDLLFSHLTDYFPTISKDWLPKVTVPAFAENYTVIYEKK